MRDRLLFRHTKYTDIAYVTALMKSEFDKLRKVAFLSLQSQLRTMINYIQSSGKFMYIWDRLIKILLPPQIISQLFPKVKFV